MGGDLDAVLGETLEAPPPGLGSSSSAAKQAVARQQRWASKHGDKAKASGHAFTGASLETYGIFGDDLRKLIKDFAKCGGDRRFSAGPNGWSAPNFIELSRQRIAVAAQIGLYNMMAKAQRARNTRRRGVASVLACLDPNIAELSSLVSLHHVASRDSSD